jgi:hypothetical protein
MAWPIGLGLGMSRIGIKPKRDVKEVAFSSLLVIGDIKKWYEIHGFNTQPGWAMLVEVEEKVSENNCCRNGKNLGSKLMVSTQNLDGTRMRNSA